MARRLWTRDEFIVTLDLYFRMSHSRFCKTDPDVRKLALLIGRTPSSAAMRLCNFISCDPRLRGSNAGLVNGMGQCLPYWEEFAHDQEKLRAEAAMSRQRLLELAAEKDSSSCAGKWDGLSGEMQDSRFQALVLRNYGSHCAVSGIGVPDILMGCHIIPRACDSGKAMSADNGLCLTVLYAKAYLDGLIGIDQDYRIHVSGELGSHQMESGYAASFRKYEGRAINLGGVTIRPNPDFLKWHMDSVYRR